MKKSLKAGFFIILSLMKSGKVIQRDFEYFANIDEFWGKFFFIDTCEFIYKTFFQFFFKREIEMIIDFESVFLSKLAYISRFKLFR